MRCNLQIASVKRHSWECSSRVLTYGSPVIVQTRARLGFYFFAANEKKNIRETIRWVRSLINICVTSWRLTTVWCIKKHARQLISGSAHCSFFPFNYTTWLSEIIARGGEDSSSLPAPPISGGGGKSRRPYLSYPASNGRDSRSSAPLAWLATITRHRSLQYATLFPPSNYSFLAEMNFKSRAGFGRHGLPPRRHPVASLVFFQVGLLFTAMAWLPAMVRGLSSISAGSLVSHAIR